MRFPLLHPSLVLDSLPEHVQMNSSDQLQNRHRRRRRGRANDMLLKEVERWVFGGADRPGIEKCFRRMTGIPSVNERMRFHPKICKMILKDVGMTMRILNMITFISLCHILTQQQKTPCRVWEQPK